jgi:hypothetical protein
VELKAVNVSKFYLNIKEKHQHKKKDGIFKKDWLSNKWENVQVARSVVRLASKNHQNDRALKLGAGRCILKSYGRPRQQAAHFPTARRLGFGWSVL